MLLVLYKKECFKVLVNVELQTVCIFREFTHAPTVYLFRFPRMVLCLCCRVRDQKQLHFGMYHILHIHMLQDLTKLKS